MRFTNPSTLVHITCPTCPWHLRMPSTNHEYPDESERPLIPLFVISDVCPHILHGTDVSLCVFILFHIVSCVLRALVGRELTLVR